MFTRKCLFIAHTYVQSEHLYTLYTKILFSQITENIYLYDTSTYIQYESECRHILEWYRQRVVKGKSFTHKFSQPFVLYENNFIQGYL